MLLARLGVVLVVMTTVTACTPYERFGADDDLLGPVDPVNFPPANLGDGGNRKQPGTGTFTAAHAFVGGADVDYFTYSFPPSGPDVDPLRLAEDGVPYDPIPSPPAYLFTADYKCTPPPNYKYDRRLEDVPHDIQGNIFTALPKATYSLERTPRTSYVPVVSQIPVAGPSLPCQKPKSEDQLTTLLGTPPKPDGKYQAWLIIDPAAGVYGSDMTPESGVGLQSWGWFNRYLVSYIDGGPIPTTTMTVMEGMPPASKQVTQMLTQKLYYPRSVVMTGTGAMAMMGPGQLGAGYDVLSAKRGDAAYSPVCAVFTYDAGMPMADTALPKDAAMIEMSFNSMASPLQPADPPYVFCLQVAKP
jgi:hypothetical protein